SATASATAAPGAEAGKVEDDVRVVANSSGGTVSGAVSNGGGEGGAGSAGGGAGAGGQRGPGGDGGTATGGSGDMAAGNVILIPILSPGSSAVGGGNGGDAKTHGGNSRG